MIAYLGTGLLGGNFVKNLLEKGNEVHVWNRSPEKAKALEASGAKAFAEAADAVKGATRIHLTLTDDQVVDDVLEKAEPGFATGVIIIDHSTTSVEGAKKRTSYWKQRGTDYIHAPVFMGPPNALDGTGYMLVCGNQEIIKKIEPELSAMTGKLINCGPDTGKAAGMKLLGNLFLMSLTAGISDTLALAKALHIPASEVETLLCTWNPGAMIPVRIKRILSDQFSDPSWELKMARKDARLMMEEAAKENQPFTIIPAIAKEMDRWIEKGHGSDDWTIIAKDNV
jgi:3-hydroxyisobutyrate dehydrogenase